MRKLMSAVALLGSLALSSAAWAVVDETQDIPVTNQGSAIPEGHITIQTETGKTIATGRIVNGKAHLHVVDRDKNADRNEKVVTKIHDNKTGKTYTERDRTLGAVLDLGVDASMGGAAVAVATNYTSVLGGGASWVTVGAGFASTHNDATGNFFGPGTGSGVLLTDNSWSGSVEFTGGIFTSLTAPGWYGGVVVNVLTTPFHTATLSGVTSNAIPVTSKVGQSDAAVDVLGRVGVIDPLQSFRYLGLHEAFVEGGAEMARYNGQIAAPIVGDNFIASKQITAPVAGVGVGFCPFGASNGTCTVAEVIVKYDHAFFSSSWLTGMTVPSSGQASVKGEDRVTVEADITPWISYNEGFPSTFKQQSQPTR